MLLQLLELVAFEFPIYGSTLMVGTLNVVVAVDTVEVAETYNDEFVVVVTEVEEAVDVEV